MDLDQLDVAAASDRGAPLTLRHPATGEEGDAVLMVLGYDSEIVTKAGRAADKSSMSSLDADLASSLLARRLAMAKAAIVSVEGLTVSGKDVDRDHLRSLLGRPGLTWIVDQINAFGSDRANFFPAPPTD